MTLPQGIIGSLGPTQIKTKFQFEFLFDVSVFQLGRHLPLRSTAEVSGLSLPLSSSVTLWEETAPVKLATMHCPLKKGLVEKLKRGWYFTGASS